MARDQTQDPWEKTPYAVKRLVSSEATQIGWLEIKRNNRERTPLEQLTCDGTKVLSRFPLAKPSGEILECFLMVCSGLRMSTTRSKRAKSENKMVCPIPK
jgi:hypothetical protein